MKIGDLYKNNKYPTIIKLIEYLGKDLWLIKVLPGSLWPIVERERVRMKGKNIFKYYYRISEA